MEIYDFLSYNQYPMQQIKLFDHNCNCTYEGILRDMPYYLRQKEILGFMIEDDIIEIYY